MSYKEVKAAVEEGRRLDEDKAPVHEQLLWYQLREWLRAKERMEDVGQEKLRERELRIIAEYSRNETERFLSERAREKALRVERELETAMNYYGTHRTREAADKLFHAISQVKLKYKEELDGNEWAEG